MIAMLQRVTRCAVGCAGATRATGPGLLVLLGVVTADTDAVAVKLAGRVAGLRIFADEAGKLNRSVYDTGGSVMVVPNFTLCADTRRGRRPSYGAAAPPEQGAALFERFVAALREAGLPVTAGWFGAHMEVELVNDGPVTVMLEAKG